MSYRSLLASMILGPAMVAAAPGAAGVAGELPIPRTVTAQKPVPTMTPGLRRAISRLDPQKAVALFAEAAKALKLPPAAPNLPAAFTLSPRQPEVPGKGYILSMFGARDVSPTMNGNGSVTFLHAGDDNHFVQVGFTAVKGLYLVRSDAMGIGGNYSADIQVGGQRLTVSGATDSNGIFTFPIYAPVAGNVYITFQSPMGNWVWNGCEIVPQQ